MLTIPRCTLVSALLLLAAAVQAQPVVDAALDRSMVGAVGGVAFTWHQGSFTTGDAQFACCTFSGGNGVGRVAGLRGTIPLSTAVFMRPGLSFEQLNADYASERKALPVLDAENNVVLMSLQQDLEISLDAFTIEVLFAYRVVQPGMYVTLGPSFSLLMSKHQTQRETILSPDGVEFRDGGRSHLLVDSEIEDVKSFVSLRAGAGALFPLSPMFYANPEVLFAVPLTNVQKGGEWSIAGFQVTIGVLLVL